MLDTKKRKTFIRNKNLKITKTYWHSFSPSKKQKFSKYLSKNVKSIVPEIYVSKKQLMDVAFDCNWLN